MDKKTTSNDLIASKNNQKSKINNLILNVLKKIFCFIIFNYKFFFFFSTKKLTRKKESTNK